MANNTYRADFIYENLQVQNNVIHNAWKYGVKKLLFLGSSCIYPRDAQQPLLEDYLLTSPLEYTNEPYAIAKIAGIKLCESYNIQYYTNFISVMPTNLYGPNDNFHFQNSHVLPGMMRKMHLASCLEKNDIDAIRKDLQKRPVDHIAKEFSADSMLKILKDYGISCDNGGKVELKLWGTGQPLREFMHVNDMAEACVFVMENLNAEDLKPEGTYEIRNTHLNLGTGKEISIKDLSEKIRAVTGFNGTITFDASKPDCTPRKLLDVSKMKNLGWSAKISLDEGLKMVFEQYLSSLI